MSDILLDPNGDVPVPDGYQSVESEVEFLRLATTGQRLLIRGERLCIWAESFYRLRGQVYRFVESLATSLRRVFPALTSDQSAVLAQMIGMEPVFPDQISAPWVLARCYPDNSALWYGEPSREHAAQWILWLCMRQQDSDPSITVVLSSWAHQMKIRSGDNPESVIYQATTSAEAWDLLRSWLGLNDRRVIELDEFPLAIPEKLLKRIKIEWNKRLIDSNGDYFTHTLSIPLPIFLRKELAKITAIFYERNNEILTQERLRQLRPYLDSETISTLQKHIPPPLPADLPENEEEMLRWFDEQYLPYRRWQDKYGDNQANELSLRLGQSFVLWYLERYHLWLLASDPAWLSFQKISTIYRDYSKQFLILCVVLDGLPAWDAEDFVSSLSVQIERLQLQQRSYCFAPLPTVTQFAKDALLKGVPPKQAPNHAPLGKVLRDNDSPASELKDMTSGLVFWPVRQPDNVYHFEVEANLQRKIHGALSDIVKAIEETVETIPEHVPFQVIITTDHGRLLNPASPRRLRAPDGTQVHGRVAWGVTDQNFGELGFTINEESGWIAVHGERFGMLYNMLIGWGEDSFQQPARKSDEPYPHGGLFPEEAIVPWFVLERDAQHPELTISLRGKGESGDNGVIEVTIINPTRTALECLEVTLSHGAYIRGNWRISALQQSGFTFPLKPWPTKVEAHTMTAKLLLRQPNGKTFTQTVTPQLKIRDLYDKPSIEDLGL